MSNTDIHETNVPVNDLAQFSYTWAVIIGVRVTAPEYMAIHWMDDRRDRAQQVLMMSPCTDDREKILAELSGKSNGPLLDLRQYFKIDSIKTAKIQRDNDTSTLDP